MVTGMSDYITDNKDKMKNKVMVIVLAVTAGTIWIFIAVKLLSHTEIENIASGPLPAIEQKIDKGLKSLSESPFKIHEEKLPSERQTHISKPIHKQVSKRSDGRLVGEIEGKEVSLVVIEISGKYHYLYDDRSDGDCRLLKKFEDDSACVIFLDDTLMMYKDVPGY